MTAKETLKAWDDSVAAWREFEPKGHRCFSKESTAYFTAIVPLCIALYDMGVVPAGFPARVARGDA